MCNLLISKAHFYSRELEGSTCVSSSNEGQTVGRR